MPGAAPRWLVVLLSVAACRCRDNASEPGLEDARASLRDRARIVLEQECGECHIPEYPTALKGALEVFDLRREEWAGRMTEAQLHKLSSRIVGGAREMFDPFDTRNDAGPPPPPSPEAIGAVQAYVRAELEFRKGSSH